MVARSGPGWVLAPSLCLLVDEFDHAWPGRDHQSDGSIGDARHQNEPGGSDHNPSNGYVDAVDIDTDLGTGNMEAVADQLRTSHDPRISYGIFNRRIFRSYDKPSIPAWTWAPYTGTDPHTNHLHLSIRKVAPAREDLHPWSLTTTSQHQENNMSPEGEKAMLAALSEIRDHLRRIDTALTALVELEKKTEG